MKWARKGDLPPTPVVPIILHRGARGSAILLDDTLHCPFQSPAIEPVAPYEKGGIFFNGVDVEDIL